MSSEAKYGGYTIDELARIESEATTGPWRDAASEFNAKADQRFGKRRGDRLLIAIVGGGDDDDFNMCISYHRHRVLIQPWSLFKRKTLYNASFMPENMAAILAARNALPDLIARIREL